MVTDSQCLAAAPSTMDFEEFLAKCGNNGRFQYILLGTFCFGITFISLQGFSQNLIGFVPDHWCYHEQLVNRSYEDIAAIYTSFDKPSCTRLDTILGNNVTISDKPCDRWIYKYDFGFKSMNTELNWVCDSAYKARVGQSFFFIGVVIGTAFFGYLGDRIGRVKTMILSHLACCAGDFLTIFSETALTYSASRFISGTGAACSVYLMLIIVLEYVSPKMRSVHVSIVVGVAFSSGQVLASCFAVWVGHWRIFLIITSLPLVSLNYFLMQESAQWLITRNDIDGAVNRLRRIAKINGKSVEEKYFLAFHRHCEERLSEMAKQDKPNIRDVLKWPRLRNRFFTLVMLFIVVAITGNIVSRNVEGMGISPFIMFGLNALVVVPSSIVQAQVQKRYGRKATAVGSAVFTAFFGIVLGIFMSLDEGKFKYLVVALCMCGRAGSSVFYQSGAQLIAELIPTSVRSRGMAIMHISGNAGSFLTPFIQHMGVYLSSLPFLVMGLIQLFGVYLCLQLPDTHNKTLPVSLKEGDEFGKDEKKLDFIRKIFNSEDVNPEGNEDQKASEVEEKLVEKSSL